MYSSPSLNALQLVKYVVTLLKSSPWILRLKSLTRFIALINLIGSSFLVK